MPRVHELGGHPVEQYTSPNAGGRMTAHHGVVLHIAEGTYKGTIGWQLNPDQQYRDGTRVTTCSTWIVGRNPGEWAQMVDSDYIAWCQRSGSRTWNSIELAGYAPDAPTEWQIEACAQILAWLHRTHGVPVAIASHPGERGLGHHSMDREWLGEEWGHDSCPGKGVIAAKPAIVARAKGILAGKGGFMTALSDDAQRRLAQQVQDIHWSVGRGSHAPDGRLEAITYVLRRHGEMLASILGSVQGDSAQQILARIDELAVAEAARDAALQAQMSELRDLVERGQRGELAAEEVVRLMGERLSGAGAPGGQA